MGGGKLACEFCRHLYMVIRFEIVSRKTITIIAGVVVTMHSCSKSEETPAPIPINFHLNTWSVGNVPKQITNYNVAKSPLIHLRFDAAINKATVPASVILKENNGSPVSSNISYADADSTIILEPVSPLKYLSKYKVSIGNQLKSTNGGNLVNPTEISLTTTIDSSRKFPIITEEALLDTVQKERLNFSGTWPIQLVGWQEKEIPTQTLIQLAAPGLGSWLLLPLSIVTLFPAPEGLARLQAMVSFLKDTAETFHGAYPHWLNGTTGKTIPFSLNDDGADLVETSYLVQGLLTARQYFDGAVAVETDLRNDINTIVNRVEWDWFRKNNEDVLYWHWSATNSNGWIMNMQIKGWNESLISYVLAASSATHAVPKIAYDNGWASNGGMKNGKSYYGYQLPLGPEFGGPLFFSHYSFLGINPVSLTDSYANYEIQTKIIP